MEYYNPIDHTSKRYAAIVTLVVVAVVVFAVSFISVDVILRSESVERAIEIVPEMLEEPQPKSKAERASVSSSLKQQPAVNHKQVAPQEQEQQTRGEAEQTQTPNQNAMFKPITGNSAQSVPVGNRLAPKSDVESNSGNNDGFNLHGDASLDEGLSNRGTHDGGDVPKPQKPKNKEGTVVVRVEVDASGVVTSATVQLDGTTTNDEELREKAIEAAKKARFRPSDRFLQGGTITYVFKLE